MGSGDARGLRLATPRGLRELGGLEVLVGQARPRTGCGRPQDPGRGCAGIHPKRGEGPSGPWAWGGGGALLSPVSVFKIVPPQGFSGVQPGVFLTSEEPTLSPDSPDTRATRLPWTELNLACAPPSPVAGFLGREAPAPPYLQNDPVSVLCSHVQRVLGHHLLSLSQGHVMEFPIVDGESQFFP